MYHSGGIDDADLPTIAYENLILLGVPWCYATVMRKVELDEFPRPIRVSARKFRWTLRQILGWQMSVLGEYFANGDKFVIWHPDEVPDESEPNALEDSENGPYYGA